MNNSIQELQLIKRTAWMNERLCGRGATQEEADKVAKAKRKEIITISGNHILPNVPSKETAKDFNDFVNGFVKELGDVLWFVALIAKHAGLTLEEVAQLNLDKLADRAKRGVIVGDGDNR